MNDHEKSHVVMQAWRFDLNAKDELSSMLTKSKIAKKKKSQNNFFFGKKLSMNDTIFGNEILSFFFTFLFSQFP